MIWYQLLYFLDEPLYDCQSLQTVAPDVFIQEDDCAGLVPQHLHSGLGIIVIHVQILTVTVDQGDVGILHIGVALKVRKVLLHIFLNIDDGRPGHEEHIVPDGASFLEIGTALVGKGRGGSAPHPS